MNPAVLSRMSFDYPGDLVYLASPASTDAELHLASSWLSGQFDLHAYSLTRDRSEMAALGWRDWLRPATWHQWQELRFRNRHYAWLQLQAGSIGFETARRNAFLPTRG